MPAAKRAIGFGVPPSLITVAVRTEVPLKVPLRRAGTVVGVAPGPKQSPPGFRQLRVPASDPFVMLQPTLLSAP